MKADGTGGACSIWGDENCINNLNGKPRNDETVWTRNHIWEDNINMELKQA
jgi:hypothetical protein